jgi:hypothetical protein
VRPYSRDGLSAFERLKLDLENVDCETGLLWWEEIRRLPAVLAADEKMELMVSAELAGEPALAVVTGERLLVVSRTDCDSVRHGTTTRLEARSDWAADVTFRFVYEGGELELKNVSEGNAARLYCRLHDLGRVPEVSAKQHLINKLHPSKRASVFRSPSALPDPIALLRQLQHRWVLKAIDQTGPRRRSLPWVAHALFMATAWTAALAVVAVIALVITAIVALVIYAS